jgi:chaperonin GroES
MSMMDDLSSAGTSGIPPQGGPTMPEAPMGNAPMPSAEDEERYEVDKALQSLNLAEQIKKKDDRKGTSLLGEIGERVVREYEIDEASRSDWLKRNEEWMKLATQVVEKKTFPWDGAANVKFPLLSIASIQFSARAYGSLIPSLDIVKAKVIGPDMDGSLTDVANTLSTHMSYQILYEMDGWEEDLDILCFVLPIVGVMFKKTYYSETRQSNVSELVHAKDLVVNYYTKSLKKSPRYTHIQYYTPNEIKERQNFGLFLEYDTDFGPGEGSDTSYSRNSTTGVEGASADDEDTPRKVLEQYRFLDLDDDGYREPYIVTVDYQTRRVLRVTPNFTVDGVDRDEDGKIRCITPTQWFTKFSFIPNPDGGFYDLGFGLLLGGLNESINTLTNQLLDAGTLNNLNAGFIAKGLRVGGADLKFKPGEWKPVNAVGDDLRKGIVPLPANPPSDVLFNLLGTLAQSGKELASVAEIFTGKMPGQNTPASTTMATIEQGLKVFTSIYKRIYRSLQQEYQKLFELNRLYMPTETTRFVAEVNGGAKEYKISRHDYQGMKVKIVPAADPNMVSETQKLMKIQGLQELAQFGNINVQEMTKQALTLQGQENIKALMTMPPPQPPLEIQLLQMELADKDKDRQLEHFKLMSEHQKRESEIVLNMAKAKQLGDEEGAMMLEAQLKREEAQWEMMMKRMDLDFKREEHQMDMQMKQEDHAIDREVKMATAQTDIAVTRATGAQKIRQGEEIGNAKIDQARRMGDAKIEQQKKMAAAKPEPKAESKKPK